MKTRPRAGDFAQRASTAPFSSGSSMKHVPGTIVNLLDSQVIIIVLDHRHYMCKGQIYFHSELGHNLDIVFRYGQGKYL